MDISIVIACSRPQFIRKICEAFVAQTSNCQFEVILVGQVNAVPNTPPNIFFVEDMNTHPNAKRNKGMRQAQSSLVALLDDDALPCANWVNTAVEQSRIYRGQVITGPEIPYSENDFALLTHRVLSSGSAEFTKAHTYTKAEEVKWYETPFCNCVFPKRLWEEQGGFSETIPWHMDDFHFFFPLRHTTQFHNIPALRVRHHRYPKTLRELLLAKWKQRQETGEKLVHHPRIYWSVPPVAFAVTLSALLMIAFTISLCLYPMLALGFPAAYLLLASSVVIKQVGFHPLTVLQGLLILISVHIISVAALYAGLAKGLVHKTRQG